MHIDKRRYNISSNRDVSIKIVQISDIHFSTCYNFKRLDKIKQKLIVINPDYVCIVGDLIDYYDSSIIDVFRDWLKSLSLSFKVIVVVGNHDFIARDNGRYIEHNDISWLKSIESSNLIVLFNEVYCCDGINFIGYSLDFDYYHNHEDGPYEKYNKELSKLIMNVSDGYNILLVHTPLFLINNDNYKNIKGFHQIDLVLCGHMHGGLVPSFIPGHFGFVSPQKKLFPRIVRGKIMIGDSVLIISSGIVKLSEKSKLSKFNDIYGYNVNVICINDKS